MGRLFDAVAALAGLRAVTSYEGQAAIELEAVADRTETSAYALGPDLDARALVLAVLEDVRAGARAPVVSARFHRAVAHATAGACAAAASDAGVDLVVLSGGVFQNRLLLTLTTDELTGLGLRVLMPERLPANDGGIAFGQAAVAAARG
jgi:hydrogenase maturation protein HypF